MTTKIKKYMPLNKGTRERLKEQYIAIEQSAEFWHNNISKLADELNILCEKPFNSPDEMNRIEFLEEEIQKWQKRGEVEEKILRNYQTSSRAILWGNLMSGIGNVQF